jgi:hypothetical protein
MIKMRMKFFIKDVIINESDHLSIFLKSQNSQVFQYVFLEFDSSGYIECIL